MRYPLCISSVWLHTINFAAAIIFYKINSSNRTDGGSGGLQVYWSFKQMVLCIAQGNISNYSRLHTGESENQQLDRTTIIAINAEIIIINECNTITPDSEQCILQVFWLNFKLPLMQSIYIYFDIFNPESILNKNCFRNIRHSIFHMKLYSISWPSMNHTEFCGNPLLIETFE